MCISCYQPNKNSVFVPVQSRLLACVCSSCLADCDTNIVELKNRSCFRHFLCDWSRGMTFPFNFSTIFTSYIYWPCNFGLFLTSTFSTRSLYVVFSEFLVASQSQFKDTNCSKVETYQDGLVWLWITQVNFIYVPQPLHIVEIKSHDYHTARFTQLWIGLQQVQLQSQVTTIFAFVCYQSSYCLYRSSFNAA